MNICMLPHALWNPIPLSRRNRLAVLFGVTTLVGDALELPRLWRTPRHVFVATTYDLLDTDDAFIREVFAAMRQAPHHEYQIETVSSGRLLALSPTLDWSPSAWVGVTVAHTADSSGASRIYDHRRARSIRPPRRSGRGRS